MKKFLYILFAFIALFSKASTIHVDPNTLVATFELFENGDTLILADGTYAQIIPFPANKIITLKAGENTKPIISFQYDLSDVAISNGGLIFDGITFNRGADYFFRGNIGNIKILKFKDCEILNVGRCFLRTDNADGYSIDSLVFDNCLIHSCGSNGWNFIYTKHIVKSLIVENSTLYNYENGESFFFANASDEVNDFACLFENNTVYKWGKSSDRALCNVGNKQAADGKQKLGRPWHESPIAVYLNTTMKIPIAPEGWTNMGAYPGLFAEYNSHDANGNPVDLTNRKSSYTVDNITKVGFQTEITAEEATNYTYENVIGGLDNWNPRAYFEGAGNPQNLSITSSGSLYWDDNDDAICYVIIKNDEVIGFSSESCFSDEMAILDGSDKYVVKSVNEYGSLSQSAEVIAARLALHELSKPKVYYSLGKLIIENIISGQEVQLYTIDGQMLAVKKSVSTNLHIDVTREKGVHIVKIGDYSTKIVLSKS